MLPKRLVGRLSKRARPEAADRSRAIDRGLVDFLVLRGRCPDCRRGDFIDADTDLVCNSCGAQFPVRGGRPYLLRHDNSLFSSDAPGRRETRVVSALRRAAKIIPGPSTNLARRSVLQLFHQEVARFPDAHVLVVGAGRQAPELRSELSGISTLIVSDVDPLAEVDLICDAHDVPLRDGSVHGVIATAVLEHVMYPERAAEEIHRVLVEGGVVYSEIPFMQQVHAGAYDFTRYTLSGHRRLMHGFHELASGAVAGPGTALVWAIEHFTSSFWSGTAAALAKGLARMLFFWLKYFDYILDGRPGALDAAACTYFLGTKRKDPRPDAAIVDAYRETRTASARSSRQDPEETLGRATLPGSR